MDNEGVDWILMVKRSDLTKWADCWEALLEGAPVSVGYARRNERYIEEMRELADSMKND